MNTTPSRSQPAASSFLPGRYLLRPLLLVSVLLAGAGGRAAARQGKSLINNLGPDVVLRSRIYSEIPAATEQCVPEECEWWGRVRKAGNEIQKKDGEKLRRRFSLLLQEGQQKGYHVPLKDRPVQTLVLTTGAYIDMARELRLKEGGVELSVEYLADGSVGDIQLVKGVRPFIDKAVIEARRQDVFLPAIKDGAFADDRRKYAISFSSRRH